jgi:hypothetical protein
MKKIIRALKLMMKNGAFALRVVLEPYSSLAAGGVWRHVVCGLRDSPGSEAFRVS